MFNQNLEILFEEALKDENEWYEEAFEDWNTVSIVANGELMQAISQNDLEKINYYSHFVQRARYGIALYHFANKRYDEAIEKLESEDLSQSIPYSTILLGNLYTAKLGTIRNFEIPYNKLKLLEQINFEGFESSAEERSVLIGFLNLAMLKRMYIKSPEKAVSVLQKGNSVIQSSKYKKALDEELRKYKKGLLGGYSYIG